MERDSAFDSTDYTWALARQRSRADDDRAAVVREFLHGLGQRLRCSIAALHRGGPRGA